MCYLIRIFLITLPTTEQYVGGYRFVEFGCLSAATRQVDQEI